MTASAQNQPRCLYRSPTGRRCCNKASIGSEVCHKHGDFGRAYAAAEEIVSNRDRLDTAEGVHTMMTRAARALAAGQISPRRASALFYGARAMHYSLRHVRAEREGIFVADEDEVWRNKAIADSHLDKLNCEVAPEESNEQEENDQELETSGTKRK